MSFSGIQSGASSCVASHAGGRLFGALATIAREAYVDADTSSGRALQLKSASPALDPFPHALDSEVVTILEVQLLDIEAGAIIFEE